MPVTANSLFVMDYKIFIWNINSDYLEIVSIAQNVEQARKLYYEKNKLNSCHNIDDVEPSEIKSFPACLEFHAA